MRIRRGDRVLVTLPGLGRQEYRVVYVGPHTVRLRRSDGVHFDAPRKLLHKQLGISPGWKPRVIPTPLGGQPRAR
jgi:hypothetical protein